MLNWRRRPAENKSRIWPRTCCVHAKYVYTVSTVIGTATQGMDMTYTVQHTQFGFVLTDDFKSIDEAQTYYFDLIEDEDTTEAWLFDGPGQEAEAIEQYTREQR